MGPEGGGERLPNLPLTRGPQGLPLSRVPFPTEDVLFRVQLDIGTEFLALGWQPLGRKLAGRCSWERCCTRCTSGSEGQERAAQPHPVSQPGAGPASRVAAPG